MSHSTTAPAPTTAGVPRTAGRRQLLLLLAVSCMSPLGAVLIAPVLPQIAAEFAATPGVGTLVPVMLAIPALLIGLGAPFAGFVVDRLDRRRLLVVALVGYAVAGTAPLYLTTLSSIIASRVVVGVFEAAIMTCATTLLGDYWSGRQRSRYLSLQVLVTALAATVFLLVGGALGSVGWRTPFWLYAVALLLAVLVVALIWQPTATREAGDTRGTGDAVAAAPMPWRRLLVPCLVTLAGGTVFFALIVELSFLLTGAGMPSPASIGAVSAVMALATAAGCLTFATNAHRTPRTLLPLEFGLTGLGFALVASTTTVPVIVVGAVLSGLGTGMLLPTLLTWSVNQLAFHHRGRGTGAWTGALYLGQFAAPVLISAVAAGVGGLRQAFWVLAVLSLLVAAVTAVVTRHHDVPLDVTRD
ncbi:MFS transporter [Modestobacter sp. Leaf380]|uniref:MFS transporter n=1 Tax=Modestobacter sp. Leaf380 TaxID=1736356 RepID=UPI0006F83E7A|nr:MFS transporter [Modestobacter sp. Leaf380]KQS71173.1 MFS transporter [Modestobacter sp. Leaf380]